MFLVRDNLACPVAGIGDVVRGLAETRVEQNWEIPCVCWHVDLAVLCFSLCMWDYTALIHTVQSFKTLFIQYIALYPFLL